VEAADDDNPGVTEIVREAIEEIRATKVKRARQRGGHFQAFLVVDRLFHMAYSMFLEWQGFSLDLSKGFSHKVSYEDSSPALPLTGNAVNFLGKKI